MFIVYTLYSKNRGKTLLDSLLVGYAAWCMALLSLFLFLYSLDRASQISNVAQWLFRGRPRRLHADLYF